MSAPGTIDGPSRRELDRTVLCWIVYSGVIVSMVWYATVGSGVLAQLRSVIIALLVAMIGPVVAVPVLARWRAPQRVRDAALRFRGIPDPTRRQYIQALDALQHRIMRSVQVIAGVVALLGVWLTVSVLFLGTTSDPILTIILGGGAIVCVVVYMVIAATYTILIWQRQLIQDQRTALDERGA